MRNTPTHLRGLAATRWVIDASTLTAAGLAALAESGGTGGAVSLAALNTPGGRITLAGGAEGAYANVELPYLIGNTGGSMRAWSLEVEGLTCTGTHGVVEAGFLSSVYESTQRTVLRWDTTGMHAMTTEGAPTQTIKRGAVNTISGISAGILVDVSDGSTAQASATGWVGGVEVELTGGVHASGMLEPKITHYGAGSISFRSLIVTAYWGARGDVLTKVI